MRKNKVPLIPDLVNCISYSVLPPWYKFKSNVYNIFQHSIFSVNQQVFKSIQINCRYKAEYLFNKLRLRFSHLGILTFKHQVLAKGQGEDAERYILSEDIMRELDPVTYRSTSKSDASELTTFSQPLISCTSSRNRWVFPSGERRSLSCAYICFVVISSSESLCFLKTYGKSPKWFSPIFVQ